MLKSQRGLGGYVCENQVRFLTDGISFTRAWRVDVQRGCIRRRRSTTLGGGAIENGDTYATVHGKKRLVVNAYADRARNPNDAAFVLGDIHANADQYDFSNAD